MTSFEKGKEYIFFAVPMWVRGKVVAEDMRFVILEEGAEHLPDSPNLEAYINHTVTGEIIAKKRVRIHKDSINVVIDI